MNKANKKVSSWIVPGLLGIITATFVLSSVRAWSSRNNAGDRRYSNALAQNEDGAAPFVSEFESSETAESNEQTEKIAVDVSKLLGDYMQEVHLLHKPFDTAMSAVVWTNYLDSLDYERVFFFQSDIAEFETSKNDLPELMKSGDISFAKRVFDRLRERVRERVEFVGINVTNDFDFTTDKTYCWKRKDMPWPADKAEQEDLWLRSIANSLVAHRVATQIANDKNTERAAALRVDIARFLRGPSESTNQLAEADLLVELTCFDAARAALPALPTNDAQRADFCRALLPTWQSPDATNTDRAVTNVVPTSTSALTPSTNVVAAATNGLTSLVGQYVAAARGIKTPQETAKDAAEKTLKSYTQYENILKDSDQEFYLTKFFNSLTAAYDPHSNYLSPVLVEDFGIDMQLSLQGIGATLQTEDGAAKIVEIIPGSPAERDVSETRLVPGDKIIGVAQGDEDFVDIRHWPLYKAVRLIRGPKDSKVRLQVIPANDVNSVKTVILIRDEIKLEEQAASSRIEKTTDENGVERKLGYIKLPTFYSSMKLVGTADGSPRSATLDVARLIADLNSENVEGIILDLRSNGGGSLPEAVYLTGLFIRTGPVVQVRESRRTITLPDNDPAIACTKPLVVMIDRLSASASEIVAGALQDYGRALIVGDSHTHGKGTVQTLLPMQGGKLGSLKATTASFYRITGSSTQMRGVASDIHLPSIFEYYNELGEDKLPNAMPWSRTGPARYRKVDTLDETAAAISERTAKRLAGNARWQHNMKVLERFGAFSTNTVISLNFEERLKRSREDEELNRELTMDTAITGNPSALDGDSDVEDETPAPRRSKAEREAKARKNDLVLDETLNVLVDLIDIKGSPANLQGEATTYDFLNTFFN